LVVLQQICPVQSLLALHDFGHVFWQMPSQQSGFVESQSLDALHVFGQACAPEYVGLKHKPWAVRSGSRAPTVVQQISPMLVLHAVLSVHGFGQALAARQMPSL
jgi:hypothetical protein